MRNAGSDLVTALRPDQPNQPVSRAEIGAVAGAMLMDSRGQMRGDTDIDRAAIAIGHDIGPAALPLFYNPARTEEAGPRVKPGVTVGGRVGHTPERRGDLSPTLQKPSTLLLTSTFTATRRFCALPSGVKLLARGSALAIPVGVSTR